MRRVTGSNGWLMFVLILVYASNFVDRTILNTLQQPIKEELGLQDWQLGLLGGTSFAVFYTLMGLVVARMAERGDRITILSICVLLWSMFTALCAAATSFIALLGFRVGVAVGEAGGTPISHALVADRYPAGQRTWALAVLASGATLGSILGAVIGAFVGHSWGWRAAFIVAGVPGILIALLVRATLSDPRKPAAERPPVEPFSGVVSYLFRKPAFRQLAIGASLQIFVTYGVFSFVTSHLMRTFALELRSAGLIGGVGTGVMLGIGTLAGGYIAQRLERRDARWGVWIIASCALIGGIAIAIAFLSADLAVVATAYLTAAAMLGAFQGPFFATIQAMALPTMRATASAAVLFVTTLFGLGLGPLFVGALSDLISGHLIREAGVACPTEAVACAAASGQGLQWALASMALVMLWASVHFFAAARHAGNAAND